MKNIVFLFFKQKLNKNNTCQLNWHSKQWAVWGCPERSLGNHWTNSLSSITAVTHTWLSEEGGEIKWPNSQYQYIRHGYCRRAYKILWGSQSTSDLRIFGVQKPISDVKTPKTSTSASAAYRRFYGFPKWRHFCACAYPWPSTHRPAALNLCKMWVNFLRKMGFYSQSHFKTCLFSVIFIQNAYFRWIKFPKNKRLFI